MAATIEGPLVVVFGAGSTIAEAKSRGLGKKELPPSDTDFFRRAKTGGFAEHLDTVADYVKTHYVVDLRARHAPRVEQVFGWVFSRLLLTPEAEQPARALLSMYRGLIAQTTDTWEPGPRGALLPFLRLVARSRVDATLITFNQDLVIERALETLARDYPGLWCITNGYGRISFERFTSPGKRHAVFSKSHQTARVPLLKLHGSLNWLVRVRSKEPRVQWNAREKPSCTLRKSVPELFRARRPKGKRYNPTWPVIVPPIASKGPLLEGVLRGLWQQAAEALRGARSLVLFGYSFPDADAQAEALFRSSCRTGQLRQVIVVNPDYAIGAKSYEVVGGDCLLHFRSVREMVAECRFLTRA